MIWLTCVAGAQPPSTARYDGRTLDDWRQVMKTLELASPAAAEAVPGLIALVTGSDVPETTRAQAAYTLGRIGTAALDAVPVLTDQLAGADETNREATTYWAAKAIGLFGAEAATATPELIAVATDGKRSLLVRLAATEALGTIGGAHPDAIPTLMQLAEDNASGEEAAFEAYQLRGAAIDGLAMIGPPAGAAVPLLIRLTRDDTGELRKRGAAALGAMGSTAAVATEALVDLVLFDDLPEVRDAAALALARIGEAGQKALVQLLTDEEVTVRRQAATALGTVERLTEKSREALLTALQDGDVHVRLSAVESLSKGGHAAGPLVPVVLAAFAEADREPRIRAYRLVLELRSQSEAIVPQLQILTNDERAYVRQVARKAIVELTRSDPERIP